MVEVSGRDAGGLGMPVTWAEVHHQAHRCKRLQDPEARRTAGRLWFRLCREALAATAPDYSNEATTKKQNETPRDAGAAGSSGGPLGGQ